MTLLHLTFFCTPPLLTALGLLLSYHKVRGINAARITLASILISCLGFILPLKNISEEIILFSGNRAGLSFIFIALIIGISLVALLTARNDEKYQPRSSNYYAFLLFFILSMILTVSFSDFRFFFISWELVLFISSLLIAYWGKGQKRRQVARRYFIISQTASLGILLSIIIIGTTTGSWSLQTASLEGLTTSTRNWVVFLFLVGFFTKLAVFPFHFWLPDAHTTAPMPVTILLASCMLPLGAYGIYRFIFDISSFNLTASFQWVFIGMGLLTKIFGASVAAQKKNIKRIIAYSSVSQAGFFLIAFGLNSPEGLSVALLHIIIHAPIKALLFICAGEIYHRSHTYNIQKISLSFKENKALLLTYLLAAGALIGIPPLSGFYSEFYLVLNSTQTNLNIVALLTLLSSLLTAIYLLRIPKVILHSSSEHKTNGQQNLFSRTTPAMVLSLVAIGLQSILSIPLFGWIHTLWKGG